MRSRKDYAAPTSQNTHDSRAFPLPRGIIRDAALWPLCRYRHKAHWTGHPDRLNRSTLNESYRFGDENYAKEELRAELASVFLAAERGIPHDPASHASYVGSWIKALREDKNEIFRAAQDAYVAADFILALERDRSLGESVEISAEADLTEAQDHASVGPEDRAESRAARAGTTDLLLRTQREELQKDGEYALEMEARESQDFVSRFEPDAGTVSVHQKNNGVDRRTAVGSLAPSTETPRGPDADSLSKSFANARAVAAEHLGDGSRTYAAMTDSGIYRGSLIGETEHHLIQKLSDQSAVAHMKHLLDPVPQVGQSVIVSYSNSRTTVREFGECTRNRELGR